VPLVGEVDDPGRRQQFAHAARDGQPADAGIEDADRH